MDAPSRATARRAYARAKRAQVVLIARVGPPRPAVGGRLRRDASGLGGHPRHRGLAAWVPPGDGAAPADAGRGRRHDRLAGRRTAVRPASGPARTRSTAAAIRSDPRRPASSPPTAAPLGRRRRDERPAIRPDRSAWPRDRDDAPSQPAHRSIGGSMNSLHERLVTTCRSRTRLTSSRTSRTPRRGIRASPGRAGRAATARSGLARLRARRPDGQRVAPMDLPDHALRAAEQGRPRRPGSGVDAVDDIRFEHDAATGRPSTTRPTSGCAASCGSSSRSSAARSSGSGGTPRPAWAHARRAGRRERRAGRRDERRDHRRRGQRPERGVRPAPRPRRRRSTTPSRRSAATSRRSQVDTPTGPVGVDMGFIVHNESPTRRSCGCSASSASRPSRAT